MPALSNQLLQVLSTLVILVGAVSVIFIRMKAAKKPATARKILIPPIGMSTGFFMFMFPVMRVPYSYSLIAFLVGIIFSIPLIISSKMHRADDGHIYLKRSPAFVIVLLGLLVVRLSLHTFIEKFITIPQTGAVFFILAFGMLLPWRIVMYLLFRKFKNVEKGYLTQTNG